MRGTVIANPEFPIVRLENGLYSLVELLGGYNVDIGDEFSGNLSEEGSCEITNITQCEKMSVVIQYVAPTIQRILNIL